MMTVRDVLDTLNGMVEDAGNRSDMDREKLLDTEVVVESPNERFSLAGVDFIITDEVALMVQTEP